MRLVLTIIDTGPGSIGSEALDRGTSKKSNAPLNWRRPAHLRKELARATLDRSRADYRAGITRSPVKARLPIANTVFAF